MPSAKTPQSQDGSWYRRPTGSLKAQALAWLGVLMAWQAGQWLASSLGLPLPGALCGMVLLLGLLALRPAWADRLEPAARPLLAFMPIFFVPAGAKLVVLAPRLQQSWLPILAVVVLSTLLALCVTAWTLRLVLAATGKESRP
jgi:putative effector of murein hydrolase LrgA (UPF0299 family)